MTTAVRSLKALKALRRAVKTYIGIDHFEIALIPDSKVQVKPGGIYNNSDATPRLPQKFVLEAYNIYGYNTLADIGGGGDDLRRYFTLTGEYDAIVEIGDHWKDGDTNYRVVSLLPKNDYETKALVIAFGKDPNYGS